MKTNKKNTKTIKSAGTDGVVLETKPIGVISTVVSVTKTFTSLADVKKSRGEVIEQNADAMEVLIFLELMCIHERQSVSFILVF